MPPGRTAGTARRRSTSTGVSARSPFVDVHERCPRRRCAHDELDRYDDVVRRGLRTVDQLERCGRGPCAEFMPVLADRREGWMGKGRRLEVVEADDGDVDA